MGDGTSEKKTQIEKNLYLLSLLVVAVDVIYAAHRTLADYYYFYYFLCARF